VTATVPLDRMTLPFHAEFSLAGLRCFLSTNSPDVLLLSVPWQAIRGPSEVHSFQMEVIEDPSLASHTPAIPHFRELGHLVFALLEPRSFFGFDLLRSRVMGAMSPAAARDSYFWNVQLLPIAIGMLGTTMGVAPLHCACLERNGGGRLAPPAPDSTRCNHKSSEDKRGVSL